MMSVINSARVVSVRDSVHRSHIVGGTHNDGALTMMMAMEMMMW